MYHLLGSDQKQYGPVPADQVRQWIAERRLNAASLAQAAGAEGWKALSQFPEFSGALATVGPIASPAPGMQPLHGGTNGMAVASLVLGIASVTIQFCCCLPVLSPVGIVFGVIALVQLKGRTDQAGKGLAWAGLILSILSLLLFGGMMAFGMLADRMQWLK